MTRDEALDRLADTVEALASAHRQLADVSALEHRQRTETWIRHLNESSDRKRDKIADNNTLDLHDDLCRLRGEVAALAAERDYLTFLLNPALGVWDAAP